MNRPNPILFLGMLIVSLIVLTFGALIQGGLLISQHEGDMVQLLDMVFRMADGERPHIDFSTPIGFLAYAPAAFFVWMGQGVGHALILAQALAGLVVLPLIYWAVQSRLRGASAWFTGFYMIVLMTALTPGEADGFLSMSMHYNRWSWALTYVVVLIAVIPPPDRSGGAFLDGVIIGICFTLLALTKATYAVALFLPIVLALATRGALKAMMMALVTGLLGVLIVTLIYSGDFWIGYLRDLFLVAASPIRPQPGETASALLGLPEFLPTNLALLLGIILLRQGLQSRIGMLLLFFAPAFFYITFQNYGNDPQWLVLVFALLLAHLPNAHLRNLFGWPLRQASTILAGAIFIVAAPSMLNLAFSPYRHAFLDREKYTELLPRASRDNDVLLPTVRASRVDGRVGLDTPDSGLATFAKDAKRSETTTIFKGETLRDCELETGMVAWYDTISAELQRAGYANGARIYEADLLEAIWLYGPFGRLKGGAPWYYGGTPGLTDADYVLVPQCPIFGLARKQRLEAIEKSGEVLTEVHRTPLFILYLRGKPD